MCETHKQKRTNPNLGRNERDGRQNENSTSKKVHTFKYLITRNHDGDIVRLLLGCLVAITALAATIAATAAAVWPFIFIGYLHVRCCFKFISIIVYFLSFICETNAWHWTLAKTHEKCVITETQKAKEKTTSASFSVWISKLSISIGSDRALSTVPYATHINADVWSRATLSSSHKVHFIEFPWNLQNDTELYSRAHRHSLDSNHSHRFQLNMELS